MKHVNQYNVNAHIIRFRSTGQYFVNFSNSFGVLPSAGFVLNSDAEQD